MTEDEKKFEEEWGKYHALLYGYNHKYILAKFYWMESRRTLREQFKSDPSIGKLQVEDWPESPDY